MAPQARLPQCHLPRCTACPAPFKCTPRVPEEIRKTAFLVCQLRLNQCNMWRRDWLGAFNLQTANNLFNASHLLIAINNDRTKLPFHLAAVQISKRNKMKSSLAIQPFTPMQSVIEIGRYAMTSMARLHRWPQRRIGYYANRHLGDALSRGQDIIRFPTALVVA